MLDEAAQREQLYHPPDSTEAFLGMAAGLLVVVEATPGAHQLVELLSTSSRRRTRSPPRPFFAGPPLVDRAKHAALGETTRGARTPRSEGPARGGAAARPAHHARDRPRRLEARHDVDLLAANGTLVARRVDEGRIVVRADAEGGRWLMPTLSELAVAEGLAAPFDLSQPN